MSSSHRNIKEELDQADEDLDDLDDVLDQFQSTSSASSSKPTAPAPSAKSASISPHPTSEGGAGLEEDGLPSDFDEILSQQFAKELAEGMKDMFGGAAPGATTASGSGSASGSGAEGDSDISEEEMMKQFEKIMQEMGLGGNEGFPPSVSAGSGPTASTRGSASAGESAAAPGASGSSSSDPANFQEAIKSTMSRLRQSQSSSGPGGTSSKGAGGGADPFGDFSDEDMAKLLQGLGGEGGMAEGEEGMAGMLEKMMGELMSKEVLYEPLKELRDKYPPYFASPPTSPAPSEDDLKRYHAQYECVSKVVKLFEHPDFDSGSESRKKALRDEVGELMNEMQESGAPPPEVVGDMPAELENFPGFGGGAGRGQSGDEDCLVM